MASLTQMERAFSCTAQRQSASTSRQMYAAAPRIALAKAQIFSVSATTKNRMQQTRNVAVKVRLQLSNAQS